MVYNYHLIAYLAIEIFREMYKRARDVVLVPYIAVTVKSDRLYDWLYIARIV